MRAHGNVPVRTLSTLLSWNDQMRTLESSLAVANLLSSGLKLIPRMASRELEPCHAFKLFILGSKYLMMPLLSAEARYAPEWVKARVQMAVSCAWRIVSKLNVRPFHKVNSPLVEPVNTRRPSGVHYFCIPLVCRTQGQGTESSN